MERNWEVLAHAEKGVFGLQEAVWVGDSRWAVSEGFNLYIDISAACNASCPFCIAETVDRKDGAGFFEGADFALDLTEKVGGTVQVVGGEPMISRRLLRLLDAIGRRNYRRVVVNTNGSAITPEKIEAMRAAGVTHVNISRHHYDENLNQEIMRLRPLLPNFEVVRTVARLQDAGLKVRINCNLIKGYIDSLSGIAGFARWCADLGCGEVSFSQTFPLGLFDYNIPLEKGYTEGIQVDLRALVARMNTSAEFRLVAPEDIEEHSSVWGRNFWRGMARRRFWLGPAGVRISIKTLSGYDENNLPHATVYNKTEDIELQPGYLAFAVLHSDGRVTASWDRRERVLFACEKPLALTAVKS